MTIKPSTAFPSADSESLVADIGSQSSRQVGQALDESVFANLREWALSAYTGGNSELELYLVLSYFKIYSVLALKKQELQGLSRRYPAM